VELFFLCEESATRALRAYLREKGLRRGPPLSTVQHVVHQFRTTGSVRRLIRRHRGRSTSRQQAVGLVQQAVSQEGGATSTRRLSRETGVSRTTVQRVLHTDLGLHPYKLQLVHKLLRGDKAKRRVFADWFIAQCELDADFLSCVLMSDEAKFQVDGVVTKQNCRIWSQENPRVLREEVSFSPSVTVWCAIGMKAIIGPFFFEEGGSSVTVTAARYQDMLEQFLLPEIGAAAFPSTVFGYSKTGQLPTPRLQLSNSCRTNLATG